LNKNDVIESDVVLCVTILVDTYSEEEYGEPKTSFLCNNTIELHEEVIAIKKWKILGLKPKSCLSKSFLEKQPGFESIK